MLLSRGAKCLNEAERGGDKNPSWLVSNSTSQADRRRDPLSVERSGDKLVFVAAARVCRSSRLPGMLSELIYTSSQTNDFR